MKFNRASKVEPLYPQGPELVSFEAEGALPIKESPVLQPEEDSACHITIRCTQPGADGEMKVTLEYRGDVDLCSFLIGRAQEIIEEQAQG